MNGKALLEYAHRQILDTVEKVPLIKWENPAICGRWVAKDVIAHLTTMERVLEETLASYLKGSNTPFLVQYLEEGPEVFCEAQVAAKRSILLADLLIDLDATHSRAMVLYEQIPAAEFRISGALAWYGADYDLEDFIIYSNYGHKIEHMAQLAGLSGTVSAE